MTGECGMTYDEVVCVSDGWVKALGIDASMLVACTKDGAGWVFTLVPSDDECECCEPRRPLVLGGMTRRPLNPDALCCWLYSASGVDPDLTQEQIERDRDAT